LLRPFEILAELPPSDLKYTENHRQQPVPIYGEAGSDSVPVYEEACSDSLALAPVIGYLRPRQRPYKFSRIVRGMAQLDVEEKNYLHYRQEPIGRFGYCPVRFDTECGTCEFVEKTEDQFSTPNCAGCRAEKISYICAEQCYKCGWGLCSSCMDEELRETNYQMIGVPINDSNQNRIVGNKALIRNVPKSKAKYSIQSAGLEWDDGRTIFLGKEGVVVGIEEGRLVLEFNGIYVTFELKLYMLQTIRTLFFVLIVDLR